jgi:hypothetical protein
VTLAAERERVVWLEAFYAALAEVPVYDMKYVLERLPK